MKKITLALALSAAFQICYGGYSLEYNGKRTKLFLRGQVVDFARCAREQLQRYPESGIQDLVKLAYQAAWGPAHGIADRERAGEYLMLRLRTTAGINREEYEKRYLLRFDPLEKILEKACHYRLAQSNGRGGYRLKPAGFLVSNSILSDLLLAQEKSETIGTRL